jgi:quercetin dioxygenase-like cupin family protein
MRRSAIFGVLLAATLGAGVVAAAVSSVIIADTNVVREKIVRTEFTPSADQPTFESGWHQHPGLAVVQVQEGRLTIFQNCIRNNLKPGDTFIEVPYLAVNATASAYVKWTTTFVLADSTAGGPDRLSATAPTCNAGTGD